jgi:inosine/xanthosine triphosphate pyrophosphatase family protein
MKNIININENNDRILLLATSNAGKQSELRALLKGCPIKTVTPAKLD